MLGVISCTPLKTAEKEFVDATAHLRNRDMIRLQEGMAKVYSRLDEAEREALMRMHKRFLNVASDKSRFFANSAQAVLVSAQMLKHRSAKQQQKKKASAHWGKAIEDLKDDEDKSGALIDKFADHIIHVKSKISEATTKLHAFTSHRRQLEVLLAQGNMKRALGELKRYRSVSTPILATIVGLEIAVRKPGALEMMPEDNHVARLHPNQQKTLWLSARRLLSLASILKEMKSTSIGILHDAEGAGGASEMDVPALKACDAIVKDFNVEAVTRASIPGGIIFSWLEVMTALWRTGEQVEELKCELGKLLSNQEK